MSTQKTAWLIVACYPLLFASEGLAQEELPDPPRWYVNQEIDPITDEKRVFTSLRGRIVNTITRDGAITGVPTLSISCNTQGTWYVRSPQGDLYEDFALDVSITSPVLRPEFDPANPNRPPFNPLAEMVDRDVIVRFDGEEPEVQRWRGGLEGRGLRDSVSLPSGISNERYSPWTFLERLATGVHRRLAIRTRDHDIVWTALFDISKAAPVAQEVLALCPESDSGSVP